MKHERKYVVYGLLCPDALVIKYIGMTCYPGARLKQHIDFAKLEYRKHLANTLYKMTPKSDWIIKTMWQMSDYPQLIILAQFNIKENAKACEAMTIEQHKKQIVNIVQPSIPNYLDNDEHFITDAYKWLGKHVQ